ncbi:MAG: exodeoxyribonuclease VII large subunit [Phycisphaeraceae bacterium]|nr:exodeoxyribonuclease VII large subunit [Phycisphaerales bacterium]MCB9861188.1 exodeoxyribonuclease VII large subunit [Phycisphaeraceae bacterium]
MRGPEKPAQEQPENDALTVSQLAGRIERAIEVGLPAQVSVQGEISGVRVRTHTYFDLKDEKAALSCVMFRSKVQRSRRVIEDGQHVVVLGQVTYYAKQGRVSFVVDSIQPVGRGMREAQLRALCDELRSLGWFDESQKRTLPVFPRNIAVVTSHSAAALADVRVTLNKRCPAIGVYLFDTLVQGERASEQIIGQIRHASSRADELGIDAILVTRGGGSADDLWCFNDREVARAIVEAGVPVVAAIGHETDGTIAELVADRRAATPTQAAMLLSPDRDALTDQIGFLNKRLESQVAHHLDWEHRRINTFVDRMHSCIYATVHTRSLRCAKLESRLHQAHKRSSPEAIGERIGRLEMRMELVVEHHIGDAVSDCRTLAHRLESRMRSILVREARRVESLEQRLHQSSVAGLLARGFSLTTDTSGRIVRSSDKVHVGEQIVSVLADGQITSTVNKAE